MIALSDEDYKNKISKISKKKSYKSNSELTGEKKELSLSDRDIESYRYKHPNNVLIYSKYMGACNNVKRLHPTQKPILLMEYLVKTYTNEGDMVLDNTMGSGTTGVACINTNRSFIGMELDDKYFEIAKARINEATTAKQLTLF